MSIEIILLGLFVFAVEMTAVTLGTIRVIIATHGERRAAFILGIIEQLLWIGILAAVLSQVMTIPFLAVCYALGFGFGNAFGIYCEKKLAFGKVLLRIITKILFYPANKCSVLTSPCS